jgi:hypothetical protein
LEREGLLIEGFDYLSTFEEQYNHSYYAELIAECGYEKDVDWVEYRLYPTPQEDERLHRIGEYALKKHNLRVVSDNISKRKFIKKYAKGIFDCIDRCYSDLYGTVPFTKEMMDQMVSQFKLILKMRYIFAACDEQDRVVGFGFCLPGIGSALQKSGGKLTPGCLLRLLKVLRSPKSVDLALIGILPEYRKAGLTALILTHMQKMLEDENIEYMETNLNLETNANIQAQWKHFDNIQHKRRRSYIKQI